MQFFCHISDELYWHCLAQPHYLLGKRAVSISSKWPQSIAIEILWRRAAIATGWGWQNYHYSDYSRMQVAGVRSSYNRSCYTVVFNVDMGWHHSNCLFCVPRSRMRRITRTTTSPLCMLIVDSCIAGVDSRGSGRQPSKSVRSPAPSHSHWNLHETLSNTLFYDCLLFRDGWKLFFFFSHWTTTNALEVVRRWRAIWLWGCLSVRPPITNASYLSNLPYCRSQLSVIWSHHT